VTFEHLRATRSWRPIPNCPGRFVLTGDAPVLTPADLVGPIVIQEFRAAGARDPVVVARFQDGGLISYRRRDGTYVHTLNTVEGFARKLQQLGIAHDVLG
jgi:hypothetical protein